MTRASCHADLRLVLESVEINSPTRYTLLGEPRDFTPPPPALDAPPTAADAATPDEAMPESPVFMPSLETDLYSRLYVRPQSAPVASSDLLAQRDFLSALSAANNGVGTWEPGWRATSSESDGRVAVSKDQVTFWVAPNGLRTRTGRVRPGDFCRVWVGKEMRQLLPGFYFAFGNGDQQESRDTAEPLLRFYWHLTAVSAVEYMALVTTTFNHARVPFRTKVMSDPSAYVRADAGVLYLERCYFPEARPLIVELHRALAGKLRAGVPLFTKPLAEGLGFAEDPSNGMSFGQSRCRIAARVMWSCFARGMNDREERRTALAAAFRAEGLDPEAPFLERGSKDFYTLAGELPPMPRPPRPLNTPTAARRHKRRWKGQPKKQNKVGV
ncbi:MAG: hypothetical protein QOJ76_2621 [Acidobacteriota bacterium]|jgi:hypothetical protein|nr:hypothetical protein [Acidobacteriota bacterium]